MTVASCSVCKLQGAPLLRGKCRPCYNAYMAAYMLKRYHQRRAGIIQLLGERCTVCGSTSNLEIDHIDRATKAGDISKWLNSVSTARYMAEVAKCQLLCRSCHAQKSSSERSVKHGEGLTGKRNCYCAKCGPLKRKYNRAYKLNRLAVGA